MSAIATNSATVARLRRLRRLVPRCGVRDRIPDWHKAASSTSQQRSRRAEADCAGLGADWAAAAAGYDRARELLVLGLDDLFLAHVKQNELKQLTDGFLEASNAALRKVK